MPIIFSNFSVSSTLSKSSDAIVVKNPSFKSYLFKFWSFKSSDSHRLFCHSKSPILKTSNTPESSISVSPTNHNICFVRNLHFLYSKFHLLTENLLACLFKYLLLINFSAPAYLSNAKPEGVYFCSLTSSFWITLATEYKSHIFFHHKSTKSISNLYISIELLIQFHFMTFPCSFVLNFNI